MTEVLMAEGTLLGRTVGGHVDDLDATTVLDLLGLTDALGKLDPAGYNSKPTFYDPANATWPDGGWWQFAPTPNQGLLLVGSGSVADGPHASLATDGSGSPFAVLQAAMPSIDASIVATATEAYWSLSPANNSYAMLRTGGTPDRATLTIGGGVNQTDPLLDLQDSDATSRLRFTFSTGLELNAPTGTGNVNIQASDAYSYIFVKANVGQTDPLLDFQDSFGSNLLTVTADANDVTETLSFAHGLYPPTIERSVGVGGQLTASEVFATRSDDGNTTFYADIGAYINPDGSGPGAFVNVGNQQGSDGHARLFAQDTGVTALVVATVGQTDPLLDLQDDSGHALAQWSVINSVNNRESDRYVYAETDDTLNSAYISEQVYVDPVALGSLTANVRYATSAGGQLDLNADQDGVRIGVTAAPGQTLPLLDLQDSSGNSRVRAFADGTGLILRNAGGIPQSSLAEGVLVLNDGSVDRVRLEGGGLTLFDTGGVNEIFKVNSNNGAVGGVTPSSGWSIKWDGTKWKAAA